MRKLHPFIWLGGNESSHVIDRHFPIQNPPSQGQQPMAQKRIAVLKKWWMTRMLTCTPPNKVSPSKGLLHLQRREFPPKL